MTQPIPTHDGMAARALGGVRGLALLLAYSTAWSLAALVLIGVTSGCLGGLNIPLGLPVLGPAMAPIMGVQPAIALIVAATLMIVIRRIRRQRALAVIGYLDQATRLNLPLPRLLWAAARSEGGSTAARLRALQDTLRAGWSVSDALDATVPEVPPRIIRLIAAGEKNGRLRETLHEITQQESQARLTSIDRAVFTGFYPVILLTLTGGIMTFLMIFVIPKFREIFNDFRTDLPVPTSRLLDISDWFANDYGWLLLIPLALGLLWVIGECIAEIFMSRRPTSSLGSTLRDHILWYLPISHGLVRNRGLADVCRVLADALRNGCSLSDAFAAIRQLHLNAVLADRVMELSLLLDRGVSLSEAAAHVKLPELMHRMFATGESSASLPETCEFLARYYRSRFNYLAVLAQYALEPAMVLCMGVLVGKVVISLFLPLVTLISSVMPADRVL